jgi:predicted homoserine dehydrogenase-like protein
MQTVLYNQYQNSKEPTDIIMVGMGFMGFGFMSAQQYNPGLRIAIIISRRPEQAVAFLEEKGLKAVIEENPDKIKDNASKGIYSITDNLDVIDTYPNELVFEVTGTVDYGTEVALRTLKAGKHLVTMNPELQATVGTQLKKLFDEKKLIITDVVGDQPGSLARLVASAKLKGFRPIMAGNMKRYMDRHATQKKMAPWALDKGLAVNQTVSFTDGTKQSMEMTLVANYFGMTILESGMYGPRVEKFDEVLSCFDWEAVPEQGVVDFMIGKTLYPGVFVVVEHQDPNQQKYLRYLNMGDGPRYVMFDPYHLCHLEVSETIGKVIHFGQETINNGLEPTTATIAVAKFDLTKGTVLDGVGGDASYGSIRKTLSTSDYLPMGVSVGAVLKRDIPQDVPIRLDDVEIPVNSATKLLGLV